MEDRRQRAMTKLAVKSATSLELAMLTASGSRSAIHHFHYLA